MKKIWRSMAISLIILLTLAGILYIGVFSVPWIMNAFLGNLVKQSHQSRRLSPHAYSKERFSQLFLGERISDTSQLLSEFEKTFGSNQKKESWLTVSYDIPGPDLCISTMYVINKHTSFVYRNRRTLCTPRETPRNE